MTDPEIFHRAVSSLRLGRPYMQPPDGSRMLGYDNAKNQATRLIKSAMENVHTLPQIYFDFVRNADINAFAFKSDGRFFIGITTGALFMLQLVIMRMLSDSRLFPGVGNQNQESSDLPPLTGYVPNAQQMYVGGHVPNPPKTEPRRSFAHHLIDEALRFLIGHEIAHITLGHVDYMESRAGTALIAEMGWSEPDQEGLIERQCLEVQADRRSVVSGIESLRLSHASYRKSGGSNMPTWTDKYPSESFLIFAWAFAMNCLFRMFGDVRFNSSELARQSYPPPPIRRAMATTMASIVILEKWNTVLEDKAHHALKTALQYTELAYATILGEKVSIDGLIETYSQPGFDYYKDLGTLSFDLQKRINRFSYEKEQ